MAFDLFNEHGHHFRTGNRTWRKFITLAMMYGWQPAGTLRPEEWDNYERLKDEEWQERLEEVFVERMRRKFLRV